jgi:hypothetical protein
MRRGLRGAKIRKGTSSSTRNTKDRGCLLKPGGQLIHVPGDGRGQRLRFIVIAERRQVAPGGIAAQQISPAPDMNIRRNSSHRNSHVRPGDASAKIARKPASVSRISHWKDQKSWPAVEIEMYRINIAIRHGRRKKPSIRTMASAAPAIHAAQGHVAGTDPEHRGRVPECARAQRLVHAAQVICHRQDALRADQAARPARRTTRTRSGRSRPAPSGTARGAVHETHSRM